MGADLISTGFTSDERGINARAARDYIESLSDSQILSITDVDWLDDVDDIRTLLKEGADVAEDIKNMRDGERWNVGDDRCFYIAGGTSFGDDPFEGFSALTAFIYACSECVPLARAANFLGPGIAPASPIPVTEADLVITPETLREIADDLEREGPDYCRTIISNEGLLISLMTPKDDE